MNPMIAALAIAAAGQTTDAVLTEGAYACRSHEAYRELVVAGETGNAAKESFLRDTACLFFDRPMQATEIVLADRSTVKFTINNGRRRITLWTDRVNVRFDDDSELATQLGQFSGQQKRWLTNRL